ncbi:hypothetical protein SpCBS45565_g03761 [Spizellomyces sp. 'palustris']|nr:hypothetical protein SpCBS45565_g03761 [Spizellomyces sp. 'palustris']
MSPEVEASAPDWVIRRGSSARPALKEKVVAIYEAFLKGDDPSIGNPNFWDEFFLLKVNVEYLTVAISSLSEAQLLAIKASRINNMFVHAIDAMLDEYPTRQIHAMETLHTLLRNIFAKKFHNFSFDVINVLTGLDQADATFRTLVAAIDDRLLTGESAQVRGAALQLTITIVTGSDNISQNSVLNDYFMIHDVFDSLTKIMTDFTTQQLAFDAAVLLTLLCNYNKYESNNPYLTRLAKLDDENVITSAAHTISRACQDCRKIYMETRQDADTTPGSIRVLSYLTGAVWGQASKPLDEAGLRRQVFLLLLYEFAYANEKFVDHLGSSLAKAATFRSGPSTQGFVTSASALFSASAIPSESQPSEGEENSLTDFVSFASYLFQNNHDTKSAIYSKLSLLILACLTENSGLCGQMLDDNLAVKVRLCCQKPPYLPNKIDQPRPLACAILDVVVTFMRHNLSKKLQADSYAYSLGIVERIICQSRGLKVRLPYHWNELWLAVMTVVQFVATQESTLQSHTGIAGLILQIFAMLNLAITYGDTFLPDPASYDNLYYEVVRNAEYLTTLNRIATRELNSDTPPQSPFRNPSLRNITRSPAGSPRNSMSSIFVSALQAKQGIPMSASDFRNIEAIINHMLPKIEQYGGKAASLTSQDIVTIIRANYETLELVSLDGVDSYMRYDGAGVYVEQAFFRGLVRIVAADFREMGR